MKKLFYLFICAAAITFATSCGKTTVATEDVDTVAVDTLVTDTAAVDTLLCTL